MNHDSLTIFNRHMCFAQHSHRKHPNASFYHLSNMNLLAQGSIGRMFFKLLVFFGMFVSCLATSSHNKRWLLDIVGRPMLHLATHTPSGCKRSETRYANETLSTRLLNLGQQTGQHLRAWDVRCLGSCLFWGPMRSLAKWYQVTNCFIVLWQHVAAWFL